MPGTRFIGDYAKGRDNNYDVLRLLAAVLVIFSHAFPISGSHEHGLDNNFSAFTYGQLAVRVFFIISGFLITASYLKSNNIVVFCKARMLRILPGLALAVVITIFVIGPLATSLGLKAYFTHPHTYEYLKTTLIYYADGLPGVFSSNPISKTVNGSLWTLLPEVGCYALVALLGMTFLLKRPIVTALIFITMFTIPILFPTRWYPGFPTSINWNAFHYLTLLRFFSAGMVFYVFRNKIPLNGYLALSSLGMMFLASKFHLLDASFPLLGAYLVFYLAYLGPKTLQKLTRKMDISYGVYIYAFPVQQLVCHYAGGKMSPFSNMAYSLPIVIMLAIVSWHAIEKPCLKMKNTPILQIFTTGKLTK